MYIKQNDEWCTSKIKVPAGKAVEIYQKINGRWIKEADTSDKNWFDIEVGIEGVYEWVFWAPGLDRFVAIDSLTLNIITSKTGEEWLGSNDTLIIDPEEDCDFINLIADTDGYADPSEYEIIGVSHAITDGLGTSTDNTLIALKNKNTKETTVISFYNRWFIDTTENYSSFTIKDDLRSVHLLNTKLRVINGQDFIYDILVIPKGVLTTDYYFASSENSGEMIKAQMPVAGYWSAVAHNHTDIYLLNDNTNTFLTSTWAEVSSFIKDDFSIENLNSGVVREWGTGASYQAKFIFVGKSSEIGLMSGGWTNPTDWTITPNLIGSDWVDSSNFNNGVIVISNTSNITQYTTVDGEWAPAYMQRDGTWTSVAGQPNGNNAIAGSSDKVSTIAHLNWDRVESAGEFVEFEGELPYGMVAWLYTFGTESLYMVTYIAAYPDTPYTVNIYKLSYGVTDLSNLGNPVFTQTLDYSHHNEVDYNTAFAGSDTVPGWHGSNVLVLAPAWPHNSYVYTRGRSQSITFDGSTFHVEHFDDWVKVAPNMGGIDGYFVFDENHQFPKYALSFENGIMFEVN